MDNLLAYIWPRLATSGELRDRALSISVAVRVFLVFHVRDVRLCHFRRAGDRSRGDPETNHSVGRRWSVARGVPSGGRLAPMAPLGRV